MMSSPVLGLSLAGALVLTVAPVGVALALAEPAPVVVQERLLTDPYDDLVATALATAAAVPQAQSSEPLTLMSPQRKERRTRGDRFVSVSATGSNDVPEAALRAYREAEARLRVDDGGCRLPWTLVAAIGRVESDHGRYGGSVVGSDGVTRPAILGLRLDGDGPVAAIRDTDDGRLDGDRIWDRAVGPMQFIPATWAAMAADGDRDGRSSPHDLDDAALAAGRYLCSGGADVSQPSGMAGAIFRYNHSDYYVALVMAFEAGYRTGVFVIPSPPPPPGAALPDVGAPDRDPKQGPGGKGGPKDGPKQGPKQGTSNGPKGEPKDEPKGEPKDGPKDEPKPEPKPEPTPTPTPEPEPEPPSVQLTFDTGSLAACGGGYCLGGRDLGFGPPAQLDRKAAHDYDGDGATAANRAELDGLVGRSVRIGFVLEGGIAQVYVLEGKDYRFADGGFA